MAVPRILGFAGPAGSGKDRAGRAVQDAFGHEPTAIADLLKDIAARCYDVDVGLLEDAREALAAGKTLTESQARKIAEVRAALWRIGDAMKTVDPDCLIRGAMRFADMAVPARACKPAPKGCVKDGGMLRAKVVFTDVRNPNEIRWIRERGGAVVKIQGPSLWGPKPVHVVADNRLETDDLPVLDVSAVAEECITLQRAGSPEPWRRFNARVVGWLVEHFGGDASLDLDNDIEMAQTPEDVDPDV